MIDRYTTLYKITGTESYRLSSTQIFGEYGGNLQNKPDDIRDIFIADEGKTLVQVDQAGAEALIVSYLCPLGNFRRLFLNGIKPHVFVAMHLFATYWKSSLGIDIETYLNAKIEDLVTLPRWKELEKAIKTHDTYYYIGKKSCHSFNYGKMPTSFIADIMYETGAKIRLSKTESERIHRTYHTLFPEIRRWHGILINDLSKNKMRAYNLFGYPRQFTGVWGEKLFLELYAFVPQSTVGTITNLAMRDLHVELNHQNPWGAELLQNGHDSILSQCDTDKVEEWTLVVKKVMERKLQNFQGEIFYMKTETGVGKNWRKYHEQHNPEGMK